MYNCDNVEITLFGRKIEDVKPFEFKEPIEKYKDESKTLSGGSIFDVEITQDELKELYEKLKKYIPEPQKLDIVNFIYYCRKGNKLFFKNNYGNRIYIIVKEKLPIKYGEIFDFRFFREVIK